MQCSNEELDRLLRPLQVKDLRALCRARGINPGAGKDELSAALKQHMLATGNFSMVVPSEGDTSSYGAPYGSHTIGGGYGHDAAAPSYMYNGTPDRSGAQVGVNNNNYSRPGGQQNVGNFITDKPSSRVLAPPGGGSTIQLGGYGGDADPSPARQRNNGGGGASAPPYGGGGMSARPPQGYDSSANSSYPYGGTPDRGGMVGANQNNYARPGGQQNVGNFITDKPSSRVLAPPGGGSTITFGDYVPPHMQGTNRGSPGASTYAPPSHDPYASSSSAYGSPYPPQWLRSPAGRGGRRCRSAQQPGWLWRPPAWLRFRSPPCVRRLWRRGAGHVSPVSGGCGRHPHPHGLRRQLCAGAGRPSAAAPHAQRRAPGRQAAGGRQRRVPGRQLPGGCAWGAQVRRAHQQLCAAWRPERGEPHHRPPIVARACPTRWQVADQFWVTSAVFLRNTISCVWCSAVHGPTNDNAGRGPGHHA